MPSDNHPDNNLTETELLSLIEQSKIFSSIDKETSLKLLAKFETINLAQGEILFEQGEPSDCLYIVALGHLAAVLATATKKARIVGMIEKGETVGELGALSRQPRTLTVRAATDSVLLKLTREDLEAFVEKYPTSAFRIIDSIISRSQSTLKLLSEKKLHKHIAIISSNENVMFADFIDKIKEKLSSHPEVIFFEEGEEVANVSPVKMIGFIDEAERNDKLIVFIIYNKNPIPELWMDYVSGIYVVADGKSEPHFSSFAEEVLDGSKTPFASQVELILMHDKLEFVYPNTKRWLHKGYFTMHHHLFVNDSKGYQRITRFMLGKALGLVLGGGGGKGWVGVGVVKALIELGIEIDAIGGTSAGAIVGSCYILDRTYQGTFARFNSLMQTLKRPFAISNFTWPMISLLSAKKATEKMQEVFDDIQIEDLSLPFFCVSCNLTTGREVIHRTGPLWEKVRASASLPGILPPVVVEGHLYVDGGLLNNLPVDCMRVLLGDSGKIIAVSLSDVGRDEIIYNFPPILPFKVGFLSHLKIAYQEFKFPPFFYTFLNALLVGSSSKEKSNGVSADVLIRPDMSKFQSLASNVKKYQELVEIGYRETLLKIQEQKLRELKNN